MDYTNAWARSEVTQGRIMIGIGLLLLLAIYGIYRSQNELLRGALIPLSLLLLVLVGYGGYILYSRPMHARESIELYQKSQEEAISMERDKHLNDNKAGKTLLKWVYPTLMILSVVMLWVATNPYYKGMALGFVLLFLATFIIDSGFVSRSDAFISFLDGLRP